MNPEPPNYAKLESARRERERYRGTLKILTTKTSAMETTPMPKKDKTWRPKGTVAF